MDYIKLGFEEKKYFIYSNNLKNIIDDLNKENNILDIILNNTKDTSFIDKINKKITYSISSIKVKNIEVYSNDNLDKIKKLVNKLNSFSTEDLIIFSKFIYEYNIIKKEFGNNYSILENKFINLFRKTHSLIINRILDIYTSIYNMEPKRMYIDILICLMDKKIL